MSELLKRERRERDDARVLLLIAAGLAVLFVRAASYALGG